MINMKLNMKNFYGKTTPGAALGKGVKKRGYVEDRMRIGAVIECLKDLPDESVQCVVTSPPYYKAREYPIPPDQWEAVTYSPMYGLPEIHVPAQEVQLGLENKDVDFVGHLVAVFRELRRVLRKDGVCFVNMGDSAAKGKVGRDDNAKFYAATHGYESKSVDHCHAAARSSMAGKNIMGIPWRLALALQADGWILRQDLIWHKPNPMPESVRDRCTRAHEYIFMLVKSPRYKWNLLQEVATKRASGNKNQHDRLPGEREGDNANIRGSLHKIHPRETRNKRSVWTIAPDSFKEAHYATFPPTLPKLCITAATDCGDTVLDPFCGSGTTAMVAHQLGREWIGIDRDNRAIDFTKKRIYKTDTKSAVGSTQPLFKTTPGPSLGKEGN